MSEATKTEVTDDPARRVDLPVAGMTCAACAALIERRLSKSPGVAAANVNFATARATVEYDPRRTGVRALRKRIEQLGYRASDPAGEDAGADARREEEARRAERRDLTRRFAVAAALSLPVLVVSMSHGSVA